MSAHLRDFSSDGPFFFAEGLGKTGRRAILKTSPQNEGELVAIRQKGRLRSCVD